MDPGARGITNGPCGGVEVSTVKSHLIYPVGCKRRLLGEWSHADCFKFMSHLI